MTSLLKSKLKESAMSILPITAIVLIFSFTPIFSLTMIEKIVFLTCSFLLILGMGLFNLGATLAMTPMGEFAGIGLLKVGKLWILLIVTFVMGFLVTIAEPDLMVLARQVSGVINSKILIIAVGEGVGIFLMLAILKMLTHKQLSQMLTIFYMLLFALVAILYDQGKVSLLPLSFDSGGVTTGPITVPFIMAFGFGIASTLGGKDSNENSFGMVALSSVGPIIVVLLLAITVKGEMRYIMPIYSIEQTFSYGIGYVLNEIRVLVIDTTLEVVKALALIFIFFLTMQFTILKLPKTKMIQIIIGIVITLAGLVLFLTTANMGFLPIGQKIGIELAKNSLFLVLLIGFIIGMTVVLAEPAVHVLIEQVEEVTAGAVTKKSMLIALSVGVGISMILALIRIVYDFSLIYYLIPGYFLSLALSLFVPPIYTSIAFDSGGVASGPMASTFILPLVIGFCSTYAGDGKVLSFAFGIIALIAMTPLITIQLLGFNAVAANFIRNRISMKRILSADDNQIIYFER